jgi:hypothetical protein
MAAVAGQQVGDAQQRRGEHRHEVDGAVVTLLMDPVPVPQGEASYGVAALYPEPARRPSGDPGDPQGIP